MTMDPKARAPRPLVFEPPAEVWADPNRVTGMNPLRALALAEYSRKALDVYAHECVDAARKSGATWQEIGDAVGMPRSNAYRKYGSPHRKPSWQGANKPPNDQEEPS
jgi:hypothetical protein